MSARRRVDRGRAEVYAAELVAFDGTWFEQPVAFEDLEAAARELLTGPWWPGVEVSLRRSRSDADSSTTRWRGRTDCTISLAASQWTFATLVHELGHALAGAGAGHGPRFRRAHVDVVAAVLGAEEARWLAAAYDRAGLALAARDWPAPVVPGPERTDGGAIAL